MINASINTPTKISAKSLVIGDVSKRSLGLDAVDNTSDLDKPISTAQQDALDLKADQDTTYTKTEVDTNIANLVAAAPQTLDTLNELAVALGNDENFATTITAAIATNTANIVTANENIGYTGLEVDVNTGDIATNAENIVAANEAIEGNTGAIEDNYDAFEAHVSKTNNPHGVTALDTGVTNLVGGGEIGIGSDSTTGGAAGFFAKSTNGFAGGEFAKAQGPNRVQLGTGINSTDNTIQFLSSGSITAAQFGNIADIATNTTDIVASNEAIADNAAEIAIVKSLNVGTLFFLNDGTTLGSFASGQLDPGAVPDNAVRADIGHAVTILGNSAFNAALGSGSSLDILTEVTIPTSVTEIQNSAFAYQKLANIDIPNSVTVIDSQSFRANLLESLSISGSVTSIGNSAFKENLLTTVTFADTATAGLTIGASAFESNLITELNIGTSVNTIGASAFRGNDFTSINIPSTVTSIDTSAFAVNTNLNTVYAFCPISAFSGTSIFANTVSALTIYVDVDDNSWDSLEALNPSSYQGVQAVTIQRIVAT